MCPAVILPPAMLCGTLLTNLQTERKCRCPPSVTLWLLSLWFLSCPQAYDLWIVGLSPTWQQCVKQRRKRKGCIVFIKLLVFGWLLITDCEKAKAAQGYAGCFRSSPLVAKFSFLLTLSQGHVFYVPDSMPPRLSSFLWGYCAIG